MIEPEPELESEELFVAKVRSGSLGQEEVELVREELAQLKQQQAVMSKKPQLATSLQASHGSKVIFTPPLFILYGESPLAYTRAHENTFTTHGYCRRTSLRSKATFISIKASPF
jgi:hypothetical protein